MRLFLILALAALHNGHAWSAVGETDTLVQQIEAALSEEGLTGIVWSTVSAAEVQVGGSGYASKSPPQAMSATHRVQVGSVTKSVLAVGVLRLVSQGQLALDTRVEPLLTGLEFANPWRETNPITVEHLLNHTAGLDNIRMWQFMSSLPTPDTPLMDAFPASAPTLLEVRSRPGSQYSYSNMGYALAAMVIEAVTGQRYESYLDEQLLTPLGMYDSTFEYVNQASLNGAMAMGHFENDVAQSTVPMYLRPAGQFTTTAADMARFMHFLMSDGQLNGEALIRWDLLQALGYYPNSDASLAGLELGHGLAFAMRDRHGVVGQCHPGTTLGFRAYLCLFPEHAKGFFWAINTDHEAADYERFNALFIDSLDVPVEPVQLGDEQAIDIGSLKGWYALSPNNMAQFELLDLVFNSIRVVGNQRQLVIKSLQGVDRAFIPLDDRRFRAVDRATASLVVVHEGDLGPVISDGLNTYRPISVAVLLAYWASFALGLLGLAYLVIAGLVIVLLRKKERLKVLFLPLLNILAFAAPAYLFAQQSFLRFGEMTAASLFLAMLTALLPISLIASIIIGLRGPANGWCRVDIGACAMALQLCLLLFWYDLLPLVFWQ